MTAAAAAFIYLFIHYEQHEWNTERMWLPPTFKVFYASQRQGRISFYVTTEGEEVGSIRIINNNSES